MHTVPHGTSVLDIPRAPTIRSSAVTFAGLGEKEGTVHRGRMAEQSRMASISTIGMVSKLALAIDRSEASLYKDVMRNISLSKLPPNRAIK
jgi:hypothetical protein